MAGSSRATFARIRWWPLVVLAGAGLTLFSSGAHGPSAAGPFLGVRVLVLGSGFALAVFLEIMARLMETRQRLATGYHASPEAARAILDASAGLTRVLNLALAVFIALLVVPSAWIPGLGSGRVVALGVGIIVLATVWAACSLRSVHGQLGRDGQLGGLEGWNGIIYNNPRDPRLWVPKISGYGTTLNFAHRRAWIMLGSILVLSLGAAAMGVISAFCR
jgi:uncharacterized membrane protein